MVRSGVDPPASTSCPSGLTRTRRPDRGRRRRGARARASVAFRPTRGGTWPNLERGAGSFSPIIVHIGNNERVRVTAKADYAVRAATELAAAADGLAKAEDIANAQSIPLNFLVKILHELRLAGLVRSHRGPEGGHHLARPAAEISVADVLRAVEGPLAEVRGKPPEALEYEGHAEALQRVWVALRTNVRAVLETVTLADLASGHLPADVDALADERESWVTR